MATPLARLEGKYEILAKIREGGMGSVYKVRHRLLDELRVVKVMRPHLAEDEVLRERFLREAKVAVKLRHPNLAQIYDFTVDESGYAYLVMEFIDGLNLQEVIKVLGRPSLGLVLEIASQSLEALGYLHRKRIIHRDVSPDNLLVTRDDDGALQVKLIDLGIAKVRGDDDSLTSEGSFLGKVRYSSPEHFRTQEGSRINAASDLYSFGVVLYEMLTGTYPIKGTSVASLISGHLMHPPLDFSTSDPDGFVPDDLRTLVLKSMEKKPDKRFRSADAFIAALQPWIEQHPLDREEFEVIFDVPTLTTHKIRTVEPGSTQSRMDKSFGLSTTPPPEDLSDSDAELETSGTVETGGAARTRKGATDDSRQAQIRALLVGAGKLAEAEHFQEARLQLASVLEIDPDNSEAIDLLKGVDEADVERRQRLQDAAESVRVLVRAESLDQASDQLQKALQEHGQAQIFDEVREEIDAAREAVRERQEQVAKVIGDAAGLMQKGHFEEAVPLLRQGLDLEPGNRELIANLEEAEKGLEALLEQRRRAKEVEETAATIADHIEKRDIDQADHALKLAKKLYGSEESFEDLATRIEKLRTDLEEEKSANLLVRASEEIEKEDFDAAIPILEEALELAPDAAETARLMDEAREGRKLQEEARRRQAAIDERVLRIGRLVDAGRLQSAATAIDVTVDELGDFDAASDLRRMVNEAKAARDDAAKKVEELLEKALEHADGDSFAEAADVLDETRSLQSEHPEYADLVAEAETEVQRRVEAHRRRLTIDKIVRSVEKQLDEGSVEEARRELGVARRLYGKIDVLDELEATIEARQRRLRAEETENLVKNARKKKKDPDEAVVDLQAALAIDPNCEEAHRLLVEMQSAQRRSLEDRIAAECEPALATIDDLIADGQLAKALELLKATVKKNGDFALARELRWKLEKQL